MKNNWDYHYIHTNASYKYIKIDSGSERSTNLNALKNCLNKK